MQKRYVQFCLFIILVICTAVGCSSGSSSPQAIVLDKTELVASLRKLLQEQKISPNIAMKRVASNNYDISLSPTNSKFILKRKNIVGNNANEIPCCTESSEIKNDVPCCSEKTAPSLRIKHRLSFRLKLRGTLRKEKVEYLCLCTFNKTLSELDKDFVSGDNSSSEENNEGEESVDIECNCQDGISCGCHILMSIWSSLNYLLEESEENKKEFISLVYENLEEEIDDSKELVSLLSVLNKIKVQAFASFVNNDGKVVDVSNTTIEESMNKLENIFLDINCGCRPNTNTETNISTSTAEINRKPTDSGYNLDFTDLNDEPWTLKIPNKESYVNFLSPTEATISGYVLESNVKFTFHMIRESAADNYEWLIDDIRTEETNEYIIEGTIVDSSKSEVIPNATITISNKETYSDNFGRFTINLPQGEYDAVITAVGYASQTIKIQVPKENN